MKAQDFLELVGRMLDAQERYYASRKSASKEEQIKLLIASKQLEKQARAVVKEGYLEPDVLDVTEGAYIRVEQELDLFGNSLPTDPTPTLPIGVPMEREDDKGEQP